MKESAGRMRVAIVAYGHPDNVICLAHSLSKYADVVLIFITSGSRFTRSIFDWNIAKLPFGLTTDPNVVSDYIGQDILSYLESKVKIYIARTPTLKLLKDWRRNNMRYIREVATYIYNNAFDTVHFNGSSGFQTYFHYYLHKMPMVYTVHDYLPHTGESTLKHSLVNKFLNKVYTKLDYEFIQHYQFLSENFTEFYKVRPERVHTIYCGPFDVYKVFVNEVITEEPQTVLYFGRISPYKGIEYLMRAVPQIKARIPNAKIIIAGKGDFSFRFENEQACEILNYHIPNEELVNLIQRASVVVAPYTDATHSAVIMTAYAFTKPVIASSVGGIPEVVEDNVTGKLVPPKNVDALADSIVDLLLKSEERKRMKKNIIKKSSDGRLSWDKIARQTIGVYEKAINRHIT